MFERHKQDSTRDQSDSSPSRVDSLLTTDDILARVARRTRMPLSRIVLWIGLVLGFVSLMVVCLAIVVRERSEGLARARATKAAETAQAQAAAQRPQQPSPDAPRAAAAAQTPVSIRLSHVGSVYVDGRYLGMQTRLQVGLAPGAHALLVRFGTRTYSHALSVGSQAGCIKCDKRRGCGPLKTHAGH